jgi:hypothetical protein
MSIAATYVSADVFTVAGYLTSEFHAGRKIKANCDADGYKYKTIISSSYSDSTGVTTVTCEDDGETLTSNLIEVWYGIVGVGLGQSLPIHDHSDSDYGGGSVDHTDLTNLNSASYSHLTSTQKTDLTDGGGTTLHTHDHASGLSNLNSTTYYHVTQDERNGLIQPGDCEYHMHNHADGLNDMNTSSYSHLTSAQLTDLTDTNYTTLHGHEYLSGTEGDYVKGLSEGGSNVDPDDAAYTYIITRHANCPHGYGDYWHIRTQFQGSIASNASRAQVAIKYTNSPMPEAFIRSYYSGVWESWTRIDQAEAGVKGWINFNGSGTISIRDSFNVTTITDNDVGQWTITWDTDFASYIQALAGLAGRDDDGNLVVGMQEIGIRPPAAGTSSIEVRNTSGAKVDAIYVNIIASGIQ